MPASLSFLDLPFPVRLKIYAYSRLLRECPIDLGSRKRSTVASFAAWKEKEEDEENAWSPAGVCWLFPDGSNRARRRSHGLSAHEDPLDCYCLSLPTALLVVSRAVYAEAISILVGRNKFILRAHTGSDLTPLQTMSNTALSAMTSLLVRLNCWPCPRGHCVVHTGHLRMKGPTCRVCDTPNAQADAVLVSTRREGQDLLQRWSTICQRLSLVLPPGQLSLTFVCDVDSVETARRVTDPLRNLPTLKQCTIRLGREKDYHLRALAEDVSLEMTKRPVPNSGIFPFSKLPRELRQQILIHTDLVFGKHHLDCELLSIVQGRLSSRRPHSHPRICCWKCTDTFADCCCPKLFAAYSTSCDCRKLPLELFLVSKQMYEDAFQVFYSKNCFALDDNPPENALPFLESRPREALALIRRLRFVFGEEELREWNERGYSEKWESLVRFIKDNFIVPNLSIEIDTREGALGLLLYQDIRLLMALQHQQDSDSDEVTFSRILYDTYCSIGRALHLIPDLNDLYFDNGWFIELGPLLAKDIIGEQKYKPRIREMEDYMPSEAWDVPVWWYQWPTTSPNLPSSIRPLPIPPHLAHLSSPRGRRGRGRGRRGRGGRGRG